MMVGALALFRIGRAPDPFAPPPFSDSKNSGNRFDDPLGEFWTMYAAEQRRACFAETLARFRVDMELLARLGHLPAGDAGDDVPESGAIPDDWHLKRMIGAFEVWPDQRWLDLRQLAVREMLREVMAATFLRLGLEDSDMSDALTRRRDITQPIAHWAHEQAYAGIIYTSRLDSTFDCWAIFEGTRFRVINTQSIARDDRDLTAVAEVFRLRLT